MFSDFHIISFTSLGWQGHWHGGQTLVDFVQWCMDDGIEILTVYAFSTENWKREATEVNTLMIIISKYADSFKQEAITKNIRVKILATDFDKLPPNIQSKVHELEEATKDCNKFLVNICLSYGGRADIAMACKGVSSAVLKGDIQLEDINEDTIERFLTTKSIPGQRNCNQGLPVSLLTLGLDPDLLIRTSGEYRVSNFLLWQVRKSLYSFCMHS
jgi:undecaprenyl diphosphate synthase